MFLKDSSLLKNLEQTHKKTGVEIRTQNAEVKKGKKEIFFEETMCFADVGFIWIEEITMC